MFHLCRRRGCTPKNTCRIALSDPNSAGRYRKPD
jgi:hypothetical protein